MIFDFYMIT